MSNSVLESLYPVPALAPWEVPTMNYHNIRAVQLMGNEPRCLLCGERVYESDFLAGLLHIHETPELTYTAHIRHMFKPDGTQDDEHLSAELSFYGEQFAAEFPDGNPSKKWGMRER